MADPDKVIEIQETVSIPVMAKARIGHFVEAQILEALEVDYIDESEVLTPADTANHIDKWKFTVPFVCGCTNIGEALRRIGEGAAMIRTKGEAGTGDIVNAVTHMRSVFGSIKRLGAMDPDELYSEAKNLQAPVELVRWVAENGRLPVVTFTAGGIATPADAALCMQLGADGVFVGSGIFKSDNPSERAKAIVEATTHYNDAEILARVSRGLGDAMSGLSAAALAPEELLETRGWEQAARGRSRELPCRSALDDPAGVERGTDLRGHAGAVEGLRRRDRAIGEVGHRLAHEADLAFENDRVRHRVPDGLVNVPEGVGPDATVVVNLAVEVGGVVQIRIEPPEAVRDGRGVERRVQSMTHGSGSRSGTPMRFATTSEKSTAQ
jgi:pyridoxal 5'-phosphate synthase pdxS subunit